MKPSYANIEKVNVPNAKEPILVGNIIEHINQIIKDYVPRAVRHVVITDSHVFKTYGNLLVGALIGGGLNPFVKIIPPGECAKNRETKADIEDWMLSKGCNRDTCVIAFGGGVVGDLSGYVAATFLRGVDFIQIPTTLLAMVDSSIGGKTGIDAPAGKNLLGAFHHPKVVLIDPNFLKTLPKREFCNGMAEIIKTAAIIDPNLFEYLESNIESIMSHNPAALHKIIHTCAALKADVVAKDDKEAGLRCILNFGHTIGHAIEALLFPTLLHGECVAIGMVLELELSNIMGHLTSFSIIGRISRLCQAYDLPVLLPKGLDPVQLLQKMGLDKKNAGKKIRSVILKSIGDVFPEPIVVDITHVARLFVPFISVLPHPGPINTEITVPGSKSISNRVLLMSALAKGKCRIKGLLQADDTDVMLDSLKKLGVQFEWEDNGNVLVLDGCTGKFQIPTKPLYLGNAGTASRFLTTMVNIVPGITTLTGCERLGERPMEDLVFALEENGCNFKYLKNKGCIPFEVHAKGFPGGKINISASVSSQFVSSVLISAPYANQPVELITNGQVVSQPFIDMTISLMDQFGIKVEKQGSSTRVPQGTYVNPPVIIIESDASSASYPLAMAAITGGKIIVKNVGSKSIQSDSQFYTVLEKMGCIVSQTETDTIVQGPPNGALKAVEVDMSHLTDCFMTIATIAAVATGTTRITNIANQRVKECNRIAVMVEELTKCGVETSELPDGIQVIGCGSDLSKLKGAHIACHKDHRIAMSFTVLALRVPGIVITDRECVNKTYPEFWDHCEKILGIKLELPLEFTQKLAPSESLVAVQDKNTQVFDSESIIIIGMRGCGKSTKGLILSQNLNWKFLDMDLVFEQDQGISIRDFISKGNPWSLFREHEERLLKKIVHDHPRNTVIACGGGVIETPGVISFLESLTNPVIHLSRHIDDIVLFLDSDKGRPSLGSEPQDIWLRRSPLYDKASNYEFFVGKGDLEWVKNDNRFISFVKNIIKLEPLRIPELSYFLSLTYPNLGDSINLLNDISEGVNALELRVDLLQNISPDFIRSQITLLRAYSHLPIIYTVRSKSQGGKFDGTEQEMINLLTIGLKANCEFIDIETCWSLSAIEHIIQRKRKSQIIASYHDFHSPVTEENIRKMFESCYRLSHMDIVKVVGMAKTFDDVFTLHKVYLEYKEKSPNGKRCPIIAILAGEKGKLSRVINKFMTPVTHPLLPNAAAPGQLSVSQILKMRKEIGLME